MRPAKPVLSQEFWRELEEFLKKNFSYAIYMRLKSGDYDRMARSMATYGVSKIAKLVEEHGLSDEFWDSVGLDALEAQEYD